RVMGDGATDGPKNQHALLLLENGNLAMFDNQGDEANNNAGSRYVEYRISGSQGFWRAEKIREYRDRFLYSRITSDVDFTSEGNLLMAWGCPQRIREIAPNNSLLFDMDVTQNKDFFYRVDKMPLYPYNNPLKKYSIEANFQDVY
ncbi:MAG: aryl-sulfate sulfotransferase, partial [Brevinema sp.]